MQNSKQCSLCKAEVGVADRYCKKCGANLYQVSAETIQDEFSPEPDWNVGSTEGPEFREEDLSKLDYRPKKRSGCLSFIIVLTIILILGGTAYVVFRDSITEQFDHEETLHENDDTTEIPEDENNEYEPEDKQETPEEENETGEDPADNDDESDEESTEITAPPDLDLLEDTLEQWLIERVDDQDAILLKSEDLEDFDEFFERYDLAEDNVIVYLLESVDEQFAVVLLGLPFSEWSIKAVFNWDGTQWSFLREENI